MTYTPGINGMAGRMNRLTKENTTKKHTHDNPEEMIAELKGWMKRYDFDRPHRQLGRKTPYEAVCKWYRKDTHNGSSGSLLPPRLPFTTS